MRTVAERTGTTQPVRTMSAFAVAVVLIGSASCSSASTRDSVGVLCEGIEAGGGTPATVNARIELGEESVETGVATLSQDAATLSADSARAKLGGLAALSGDTLTLRNAVMGFATAVRTHDQSLELTDLHVVLDAGGEVSGDCSSAVDG